MKDTEPAQHAESVPFGDAPISLEHLQVARLEPGDKLVLTCPEVLTQEGVETIGAYIRRCFPGVECLILSAGMELGIVRHNDGDGVSGGAVQGGTGSLPDASGSGSPKGAQIDGSGSTS